MTPGVAAVQRSHVGSAWGKAQQGLLYAAAGTDPFEVRPQFGVARGWQSRSHTALQTGGSLGQTALSTEGLRACRVGSTDLKQLFCL